MPRISTPTVSDALRSYVRGAGLAPRVRDDRRSLVTRFARTVNDCQVASLTPMHVRDFLAGVDVARSTFMKYRSHFAKFFEFCAMNGWLRKDLMVMVPKYRATGRRVRWQLTPGQVTELLSANEGDKRNHALLVIVLNTGLRISEVTRIKYGNLSLTDGRILIRITKTDEEDSVRITPTLDRVLRSYLSWYTVTIDRPLRREDFLFPGRTRPMFIDGTTRVQRINPGARMSALDVVIQGAYEKAGFEVESGEGWHTLRRTAARTFFDAAGEQGHDGALRITSALLHHASAATTERYLGVTKELTARDDLLATDPFAYRPAAPGGNVVPMKDRGTA